MPPGQRDDWRREFGLDARGVPSFFSSARDIDDTGGAAPQPHALRRAFEQLRLDGILCQDKTPLIYFRRVDSIDVDEVARLCGLFWNQGVASILVLIAPNDVHVFSSLAPRQRGGSARDAAAVGLVEILDRVAEVLQGFILSVESGEYFHAHRKSFDPEQRVDRNLLRNLQSVRERLDEVPAARLEPRALDALLCRLVFTCYLFDRGVIDRTYLDNVGIRECGHLRDILGRESRSDAKAQLYKLFEQLSNDFNGDLFSDDLEAEARQVKVDHIDILDRFMRSTDMRSGQQSIWPYDFGIIPIETISAIYENFLKGTGEAEKKQAGAFYTPRFLAELVLDVALDGIGSLLDKRFLDPACGSGIFLVGLFNRLAEAWRRANPTAQYDRRATGLMRLLKENLYGIDSNPTACRIAAFSLYLAFLDQLSPPDIRKLQSKGKMLPRLVRTTDGSGQQGDTIHCADFFSNQTGLQKPVHVVVGNPPWASVTDPRAPVVEWVSARAFPFPDRQIANAFVWKAPEHLEAGGKVCFVLPHGTLFNHNAPALEFQREWMCRHGVEIVLNLADYQRFLFEEAESPALVVRYSKEKPANSGHIIDYWAPKTDWSVRQAEIITVLPIDRSRVSVREVLNDLKGEDAPLIWKERFWATPRDRRLLDRLSMLPRLRDLVGKSSRQSAKRWLIAEGFQPLGKNDPEEGQTLKLPSERFVEATSPGLNLFLLPDDCRDLDQASVIVRDRSNKNSDVFRAPHVLITKGFSRSAFADFDVSFRHAVRGIHGPREDRDLLIFLAAYLRSSVAKFYLFHTSSNWGVSRAEVHVAELLRLPFPLPEETPNGGRSHAIIQEVVGVVDDATNRALKQWSNREEIVVRATMETQRLVEDYFDVDDVERMLIRDTDEIIIPSVRPTRARVEVPTLRPTREDEQLVYVDLLCSTLNRWASQDHEVHGAIAANLAVGIGLVVLEKTRRGARPLSLRDATNDLFSALYRLQQGAAKGRNTIELIRGLKVFDKNLLYFIKPLGRRFWSTTAALNDADEIATTILMKSAGERG